MAPKVPKGKQGWHWQADGAFDFRFPTVPFCDSVYHKRSRGSMKALCNFNTVTIQIVRVAWRVG